MRIDLRTLSSVSGRNQSTITFNNKILEESGFTPGEYINAIFEKGKIVLVREKDIEKYILEKEKIENLLKDTKSVDI